MDSPQAQLPPGVLVQEDPAGVARAGAELFVQAAKDAAERDGAFTVALSGGRSPAPFYRLLTTEAYRSRIDWQKVIVFWGDERPVPPESPESNYGMARDELLAHVPIPPSQVHRMHAEEVQIGRAAQAYEDLLRRVLRRDSRGLPRFHLILLGLGTEGHVASLFPEPPPSLVTSRWVITPLVPKLGTRRLTLTLPVLNAADQVVFLVAGEEKAGILVRVLFGKSDPPLPAQLVQPVNGQRIFLVDKAAASKLVS